MRRTGVNLSSLMDVEGIGTEGEAVVTTAADTEGPMDGSMGSVGSVGSVGSLGGSSSSLPKKRKKEVENLKLGRGVKFIAKSACVFIC